MSRVLKGLFLGLLVLGVSSCPTKNGPLHLQEVGTGFEHPLFVTSPPGDASRLFVVEQTGRIFIIKDGARLDTPFLDISGLLGNDTGEQGLLGLAFSPDYASNGFFYVDYIGKEKGQDDSFDTVVSRFHVSANADIADPASESVILRVDQPFDNHNGGMLAFGPQDHLLYIGLGDGGSGNDPNNNAQNLNVLLGKLLRIDVDHEAPYSIPADNPQANQTGKRGEVWAYGLRNPWRFSFDRQTGDLWIGDVGQDTREEIDFEPAASAGLVNYGWRNREGAICRPGEDNCDLPGAVDPIYDYAHPVGNSVTGGYVYRGNAMPDVQGTYFFADYVSRHVWSLKYDGAQVSAFTDRSVELSPPGLVNGISSFGEDGAGELYIVGYAGTIHKIVHD